MDTLVRSPMLRTVWFVLDKIGAADSQELYRLLLDHITTWKFIATDDNGNATYQISCNEEYFEDLRKLFHNRVFVLTWGVIQSGVIEGEKSLSWPFKKTTPPAPAPTQIPKKTRAGQVWDCLRSIFGPEIIK